ncbi:MAG TPA: aminopeptidase [Clostridia bacterium]|nr:aminopeptidase [Clostridia bacterium]
MKDDRARILAEKLVNYSCKIAPGEYCIIESTGADNEFVKMLVREVYKAKGIPFVWLRDSSVQRELLLNATPAQLDEMAAYDSSLMEKAKAYIGVRAGANIFESSDVPQANMVEYEKRYSRVVHSDIRVAKTKWVILRYPNPSMAQLAHMSTAAFEDFYFNVCNLDYAKMSAAMDKLVELMQRTDKVRITGKGTDLTFSIKGMKAIKCDGHHNIPDGEVYTAPVLDSVQGYITYNTPSMYQGFTYDNIRLEFENGKIVKADANATERINKIFDTDKGARYIGEFSIGVNPYITSPMLDTLFDEKIAGSIHFTPGMAYEDADNSNRSAVHWDLVYIQTPEYGGGEILFDGVTIRKDGRFVLPELECLNPEALV